jgi:hypothetical protein
MNTNQSKWSVKVDIHNKSVTVAKTQPPEPILVERTEMPAPTPKEPIHYGDICLVLIILTVIVCGVISLFRAFSKKSSTSTNWDKLIWPLVCLFAICSFWKKK